jgi:hypothetical protein
MLERRLRFRGRAVHPIHTVAVAPGATVFPAPAVASAGDRHRSCPARSCGCSVLPLERVERAAALWRAGLRATRGSGASCFLSRGREVEHQDLCARCPTNVSIILCRNVVFTYFAPGCSTSSRSLFDRLHRAHWSSVCMSPSCEHLGHRPLAGGSGSTSAVIPQLLMPPDRTVI